MLTSYKFAVITLLVLAVHHTVSEENLAQVPQEQIVTESPPETVQKSENQPPAHSAQVPLENEPEEVSHFESNEPSSQMQVPQADLNSKDDAPTETIQQKDFLEKKINADNEQGDVLITPEEYSIPKSTEFEDDNTVHQPVHQESQPVTTEYDENLDGIVEEEFFDDNEPLPSVDDTVLKEPADDRSRTSGQRSDEAAVKETSGKADYTFPDPFNSDLLHSDEVDEIIRKQPAGDVMETTVIYKPDRFGRVKMEQYVQQRLNGRIVLDYHEYYETHPELVTHKDVLEAHKETTGKGESVTSEGPGVAEQGDEQSEESDGKARHLKPESERGREEEEEEEVLEEEEEDGKKKKVPTATLR